MSRPSVERDTMWRSSFLIVTETLISRRFWPIFIRSSSDNNWLTQFSSLNRRVTRNIVHILFATLNLISNRLFLKIRLCLIGECWWTLATSKPWKRTDHLTVSTFTMSTSYRKMIVTITPVQKRVNRDRWPFSWAHSITSNLNNPSFEWFNSICVLKNNNYETVQTNNSFRLLWRRDCNGNLGLSNNQRLLQLVNEQKIIENDNWINEFIDLNQLLGLGSRRRRFVSTS